jgi:hypothetical protein
MFLKNMVMVAGMSMMAPGRPMNPVATPEKITGRRLVTPSLLASSSMISRGISSKCVICFTRARLASRLQMAGASKVCLERSRHCFMPSSTPRLTASRPQAGRASMSLSTGEPSLCRAREKLEGL